MILANTSWPPAELDQVFKPIALWAAWYEGDPDKLADLYSGISTSRPSQTRGGVVGRITRWFWGQQAPAGQARPKLHMPVASDIATVSADLLFGEELQLEAPEQVATVDDAGKPVEDTRLDRLREILDGNNWQSLLPEAGEAAAALTGVYLRLGWDTSIAQHPLISVVHADHAIPTFRWGHLVEVTFWQDVKREGASVWRHLETHAPGKIVHQLYQGTATNLGSLVPLTESDVTKDLPVTEDFIATGITSLTATYVPNIKPTRKWRNDPVGRNMGRSDFDGAEPIFDAIDETWTSWMRDLRLGKARIMVAQQLLTSNGPGAGAYFDLDQELFTSLSIPMNEAGTGYITAQQFDIRVTQHMETLHELLQAAYQSAGYSPATFGMQDQVATTATEVAARERRTMTTREKKTRYWTAALEPFLETLTALDKAQFGQGEILRPKVTFPQSVSPTLAELAQSVALLANAMASSIETRVRMLHADWDDTQVEEEVAKIMAENSMSTPTINLVDPTIPTASIDPAIADPATTDATGLEQV